MPILNRKKPSSHEREFDRKAKVVEYDLWVCRAAVLIAAGYSERRAKAHLATEMAVMPSDVAEAVSHAAECHQALSGRLRRPNRDLQAGSGRRKAPHRAAVA
jgi:hypothetical protein